MESKLAEMTPLTGGETTNGQPNGIERQHRIHALIAAGNSMRKREVQRCQCQPVSSDCMFRLVPFVFLQKLQILAVSRPDSSNCHERNGRCGHHTFLYARRRTFFSFAHHSHNSLGMDQRDSYLARVWRWHVQCWVLLVFTPLSSGPRCPSSWPAWTTGQMEVHRSRRRHLQWYVLAGYAGDDTPRAVFFDVDASRCFPSLSSGP